VVEVDEDDLVVERRARADLDTLVRGDDAALAELRAGADARLAVDVEARARADAAAVLERHHGARRQVEPDAGPDPDVALGANASVRAQACERDPHHLR
jgi:hypothetical protein